MHDPIWSPSEAREAIRADLSRVRRAIFRAPAVEPLLVEALRADTAVDSFEAFTDLARRFVEAHGIASTPWTAEQHAVEAAACRARAREWSELAEKAMRDKDEALALVATKAATEADRSADHHTACARALGGAA